MCQYIETIQCKDGQLLNIKYHNQRMNFTRKDQLNSNQEIYLEKQIDTSNCSTGTYKIRVIYEDKIQNIEFQPYTKKLIHSLKIVHALDSLSYAFKYADRSQLDNLVKQKDCYDEILIVKSLQVTDTSYTNVVFFDGKNYFTPSASLLRGTKREKLLSEKTIQEREIFVHEIANYREVHLINSMLDLGDITLPVSSVAMC